MRILIENYSLLRKNIKLKSQQIAGFLYFKMSSNYLTNFLYLMRFGIKSPPKRFFLFSS